ncbi:CYFA0S02e06018g1_1 [Cyberlindnera fabianii]|uniref:CYFA0S02e06018g1_1 n=1 Tax=Cyberlindnera fabianii TaxID=36022 RepID=A0A061ANS5_CYBFA|nr:CYFA0S02e06018g1_1 [Cyberlindnera fabianii]
MPSIDLLKVSTNGIGLMSLTTKKPPVDKEVAFSTMNAAINKNLPLQTFFNGGEFYGPNCSNLIYIRDFFAKYPEQRKNVIISIKGCIRPDYTPDPSKEGIEKSINNILSYIPDLDIFEPGRLDPEVPFEETTTALDAAVDEGKIKAFTLSEVSGATLGKIYKLAKHKPVGVEVEYSLITRDIATNGLVAIAGELGVPIIAYTPVGRGLLTGAITKPSDIAADDMRRMMDRFTDENIVNNQPIVSTVVELSKKKGVTPAQVAIGWVKFQSEKTINDIKFPRIIPIPSCSSPSRVEENFTEANLTQEEFDELTTAIESQTVHGMRYGKAFEKYLNV